MDEQEFDFENRILSTFYTAQDQEIDTDTASQKTDGLHRAGQGKRKSEGVYRCREIAWRYAGSCFALRSPRTWEDYVVRYHCQ